jgi:hypothetical protein
MAEHFIFWRQTSISAIAKELIGAGGYRNNPATTC